MKKFISAAVSAILAAASAMPAASFAEDEYIPLFYMKLKDNSAVTFDEDGTAVISRDSIGSGLVISADIYFEDTTLSAWSVSPRWKTSTNFIDITNIKDPVGDELLLFAYAEKDTEGNIVRGSTETDLSYNSTHGTYNFTCRRMNGNSLEPYGTTSDEFPLVSFDLDISPNTPYGEHTVMFATENGNVCRAAMNYGNRPIFAPPRTQDLKIRIEGVNLGDINNDGAVNSVDASLALIEYSTMQTGGTSTLNSIEREAADVNFDGSIDSSDASDILIYYAYTVTTKDDIKSIKEYFGR